MDKEQEHKLGQVMSLLADTDEIEVLELLNLTSDQLVGRFEDVIPDRLDTLIRYFGLDDEE